MGQGASSAYGRGPALVTSPKEHKRLTATQVRDRVRIPTTAKEEAHGQLKPQESQALLSHWASHWKQHQPLGRHRAYQNKSPKDTTGASEPYEEKTGCNDRR